MSLCITLLIGPPACGKNTYAQKEIERLKNSAVVLCRDNMREMVAGGNIHAYKFNSTTETVITKIMEESASLFLQNGKHVIIADTNLNPKTQLAWKEFAKKENVPVHKKDFFAEYLKQHQELADTVGAPAVIEKFRKRCQEWNLKRIASVPPAVIDKMINDYITPQYAEVKQYTGTPNKPRAVIVDLDGTLFHMNNRSAFEWDKVHTDTIDPVVLETIQLYKNSGYKIIACSGRDACCRELSVQCLQQYNVPYDEFFMRKEHDMRPDWAVKSEIFWNSIADNYNVQLCLDDRNQVVNLYRQMGIKVYQVQPGDF